MSDYIYIYNVLFAFCYTVLKAKNKFRNYYSVDSWKVGIDRRLPIKKWLSRFIICLGISIIIFIFSKNQSTSNSRITAYCSLIKTLNIPMMRWDIIFLVPRSRFAFSFVVILFLYESDYCLCIMSIYLLHLLPGMLKFHFVCLYW